MRKSLCLSALVLLLCSLLSAQSNPPSASEVEQRANDILSKMTLEEKIDYLGGVDEFYIRTLPRLGLPAFKMADGPVGVRNYGPSTTMGGVALAATWDPEVVRRLGVTLGQDSRARGVHFLLGPGVNIYRAPMAGRSFEYLGEDPYLAGRIAAAYITGLQSQNVCATIKHYMGNNQEYSRHKVDSLIDERTMREIYLPVFETAVKDAHVCAIMTSYNLTNGEHMSQNGHLNNDVAKKEWGFDGILMSDWGSTYDAIGAVNGGLDLEMPSGEFMNRKNLLPAIKSGKVSTATIDDHVRRILRKAIQFGWLDHEQTDLSIPRYNQAGRAVALQAAREGMVLLKNENDLLPLDKTKTKTVLVVGPDAYPAQPVGGGSAGVKPFAAISYMEGLANYLGTRVTLTYHPGIAPLSDIAGSTPFSTDTTGGKPGLKAEYFKSVDLSGALLETRVDEHINFGWNWPWFSKLPEQAKSVRWSGYYTVKDAGEYVLFVQGPGEGNGYRLFLDDKKVVDNWSRAEALISYATLKLAPGAHKVRLEFYRTWSDPDVKFGIFNQATVVDAEAKALAARADAVVVAVGFDPNSESEGSDRTFALPPGQDVLIQQMRAANKNTIVVLTSGGGVDMNAWIDKVPAIFESWYSGQEGGTALAQLLFGDYSPSGKLPASFERRFADNPVSANYYPNAGELKLKYNECVFLGYRYYDKGQVKPLFPFGFGLSYTSFKYSKLTVAPENGNAESVTVSFEVTNTGSREGAEVAELYVGDRHASVPRPIKELKGFARVDLLPGETKSVSLKLDRRAFSYYDAGNRQWAAEPGDFDILIGSSSDNIELRGRYKLSQ
ncbi:MAG: glycoside hydrolase family 3 C-terminal domain-containing protein [Acidobacteria bacterium]|nr:glycoside hydrolase family 3 C-terminal domain-containing protein [Acidobacteriota bacterium]